MTHEAEKVVSCVACDKTANDGVHFQLRNNVPVCTTCYGFCIYCKKVAWGPEDLLCYTCRQEANTAFDQQSEPEDFAAADDEDHRRHTPRSPVTGRPYDPTDIDASETE